MPDENADMGTHEFRYALYPHKVGIFWSGCLTW